MSILNQLKNTLSLFDAATYLREAVGGNLQSDDLLELAAEGKIPVQYNFDGQPAVYIPTASKLNHLYKKVSPDYIETEEKRENSDEAITIHGIYTVLPINTFLNSIKAYRSNHHQNSIVIDVVRDKDGALYHPTDKYDKWQPESEYFIFNRNDLDQLIEEIKKPPKQSNASLLSNDSYISPYMQLMKKCIAENGITEKNQDKKKTLTEWFVAQSTTDLPVSGNLANAMASLIRTPESAKGGNKKYKKK